MTDYPIARTIGELISILSDMDPNTVPMSHEPPFTGVKVVEQNNGKVMIASLWDTDEGRAQRAEHKLAKVAHTPTKPNLQKPQ